MCDNTSVSLAAPNENMDYIIICMLVDFFVDMAEYEVEPVL